MDPFKTGVASAAASKCTASHILGRLDVENLVHDQGATGNKGMVKTFHTVCQTLVASFQLSSFTAVLLVNWSSQFPPVVFNELIRYANTLGLDVYLEIAAPTFLTEEKCREIDLSVIKGIVCRNGSILPDGSHRNYFQMIEMRRALRALKVQTRMGASNIMFWETIDDDVELKHCVIKRSFIWCKFNSVIAWIGPRAALMDEKIAMRKTVQGEPLGAMMWLKSDNVVKVQDLWRNNNKVRGLQNAEEANFSARH